MTEFAVQDLPEQAAASRRATIEMSETAMRAFFDTSFSTVIAAITAQGLAPAGPPFAIYHGKPTDTIDVEAGFPVAGPGFVAAGEVLPTTLPACRAVVGIHEGAFDKLGDSWAQLEGDVTARGMVPGGFCWEVYLTDPTAVADESELRTQLVQPVS